MSSKVPSKFPTFVESRHNVNTSSKGHKPRSKSEEENWKTAKNWQKSDLFLKKKSKIGFKSQKRSIFSSKMDYRDREDSSSTPNTTEAIYRDVQVPFSASFSRFLRHFLVILILKPFVVIFMSFLDHFKSFLHHF